MDPRHGHGKFLSPPRSPFVCVTRYARARFPGFVRFHKQSPTNNVCQVRTEAQVVWVRKCHLGEMRGVSLSTALGSRSLSKERQCARLGQPMRLIGRQPYITTLEGCEVTSEGPVGWESPVEGGSDWDLGIVGSRTGIPRHIEA